ncbi:MAG TPA: type II toxin-antitoxin system death-on-curing family toxin [Noviherbaspirillum sp.]|nr:type II toxin-antitoxin system death-on-curing family toxin [Noviherbaspirillum sp.]
MNLHSIDADALLFLHQESLGTERPVCDRGLLNAALAYPLVQAETASVDVAMLAAAYAFGVLKHRPFTRNNESAAFIAMGLFLYANDWRLTASPEEATDMLRCAAAGTVDEAALANWIRANL